MFCKFDSEVNQSSVCVSLHASLERRLLLVLGSPCSSSRTCSCCLWGTWPWRQDRTSRTTSASRLDPCASAKGSGRQRHPSTVKSRSWTSVWTAAGTTGTSGPDQSSEFSRTEFHTWIIHGGAVFVYRDFYLVLNNLNMYVFTFFIFYFLSFAVCLGTLCIKVTSWRCVLFSDQFTPWTVLQGNLNASLGPKVLNQTFYPGFVPRCCFYQLPLFL